MNKGLIRLLAGALIVSTLPQVSPAKARNQNERDGALVGGIIGAIVGNAAAGRGDRAAGTIIGAIAGAAIGSVVGHDMDEQDRRAMRKAQEEALRGNINRPVRWDSPSQGSRSAHNGEFRVIRGGRHRRLLTVCREYVSVIYSPDGRREEIRGATCQSSDGSWSEVQSTEISWEQGERPVIVVRDERRRPRTEPWEDRQGRRDSVCSPRYQYALDDLARMDQDLNYWYSEMRNASYGGSAYRRASEELSNVGRRMQNFANETDKFSLLRLRDLEQAALSCNDKMNSSSYGTVPYQTYGELTAALTRAMEQSLRRQMDCMAYSSEELVQMAQEFDRKQAESSYGTRLYNAYKNLSVEANVIARQALRTELRDVSNYRFAESIGVRLMDKMISASYGTALSNATKEMSQVAFQRSEELLRRDARYMSGREAYELTKDYESRMNSISYGSMAYSHYRNMRSILDSVR